MACFQALTWEYGDFPCKNTEDVLDLHDRWRGLLDSFGPKKGGDEDEEEYQDDRSPTPMEFFVSIFGRDAEGRSVCLQVPFCPYFFVEMPAGWTPEDGKLLGERLYLSVARTFPGSLVSVSTVYKKKFDGYHGDRKFGFYKVVFRCQKAASICARKLMKGPLGVWKKEKHNRQFTVYEGNVDPVLRFMHEASLDSTGWINVDPGAVLVPRESPSRMSICDLEFFCAKGVSQVSRAQVEKLAPLVVASFDIECYSPTGSFPDHADPGCYVTQIATTLQRYGSSDPFKRHVVTLKTCAEIENVLVESYDTEAEVLESWSRFVKDNDVDLLVGYNIHGFDLEYIACRALMARVSNEFYHLGKMLGVRSELTEKKMSSSAYGDNTFKFLNTPGILQLDVLTAIKRDHKLDSYKLDNVASHFLKERKLDLPPQEIFAKFREGTPEAIRTIAEYAVQDTCLPLRLIWKLDLITNLTEMAKVTGIPTMFLLLRGQQIRAISLILKYTMRLGFLLPTNQRTDDKAKKNAEEEEDNYVGATVLDPKIGVYYHPISCLDFASLYPTIMRAHNLCHSTLVSDPKYSDEKDVVYETVSWEEEQKKYEHTFVQSRRGILPQILDDLTAARKEAKKSMAMASDPFQKSLYNSKQLALKVSSNSLYGVCGASNGILSCKPIAASVTATGRKMILKTKEFVETNYPGTTVVYGDTDSVFVRFPETDMEATFKIAEEAALKCTEIFRKPIE